MRTVWLGAAGIGLALGLGAATAQAGDMAPMQASMQSSMESPMKPPVAFSPGVAEGIKRLYARDYTGAVARLTAATEADPADPAARYYLGYTYYRMGDFGPARTAFAEAYRLDPHFSPDPKAP